MSKHHRAVGWVTQSRKWRPLLAAQLPAPCLGPCLLNGTVTAEDTWHVGHVHPLSEADPDHVWSIEDFQPIHAVCNRIDGSRLGGQKTAAKKSGEDKRLLNW
jgi:5-methylcytosine-specific restriction endonuclease McrA